MKEFIINFLIAAVFAGLFLTLAHYLPNYKFTCGWFGGTVSILVIQFVEKCRNIKCE